MSGTIGRVLRQGVVLGVLLGCAACGQGPTAPQGSAEASGGSAAGAAGAHDDGNAAGAGGDGEPAGCTVAQDPSFGLQFNLIDGVAAGESGYYDGEAVVARSAKDELLLVFVPPVASGFLEAERVASITATRELPILPVGDKVWLTKSQEKPNGIAPTSGEVSFMLRGEKAGAALLGSGRDLQPAKLGPFMDGCAEPAPYCSATQLIHGSVEVLADTPVVLADGQTLGMELGGIRYDVHGNVVRAEGSGCFPDSGPGDVHPIFESWLHDPTALIAGLEPSAPPGGSCQSGEVLTTGCFSEVPAVCKAAPTSCPQADTPVCGCNDVTFANSCEAARAGAAVAYEGQCDVDAGHLKLGSWGGSRAGMEVTATGATLQLHCGDTAQIEEPLIMGDPELESGGIRRATWKGSYTFAGARQSQPAVFKAQIARHSGSLSLDMDVSGNPPDGFGLTFGEQATIPPCAM